MKRKRGNSGFTMAELLIVVAIIGVLAGVSFVAVQTHQKNLKRLELDSVARQIFVAAQNHLTMAENENYQGVNPVSNSNAYGKKDDARKEGHVYYFEVNRGSNEWADKNTLLDQMLPFGSVDENVRTGNYIICYQPESATVLDVFYSEGTIEYSSTMLDLRGDNKASARRDFDPMIGWYGWEEGISAIKLPEGAWLEQPRIEIENAEKLTVKVADMNKDNKDKNDITLQLIITGLNLSGEATDSQFLLVLKGPDELKDSRVTESTEEDWDYVVTLDDIIEHSGDVNMHFSKLDWTKFVPGQDISIQAVAFNSKALTNVAKSDIEKTNSLFERIEIEGDTITAYINNIRHLENLSNEISGLDIGSGYNPRTAVQTSDLIWDDFVNKVQEGTLQITDSEGKSITAEGCFMPVNLNYVLSYDGQYHNITGITVNHTSDAGLFGKLDKAGTAIANLSLIDFSIAANGSGNAGALAGTMENCTVSNVLARNSSDSLSHKVSSAGGSAGGLIGSAENCNVGKSAAALIVNGSANAGGLIGTTSGGNVSACYSGGHTIYDSATGAVKYSDSAFNVTGTTTAGGLIGDAGNTTIENCYSTCSVSGATAGGLVGSSTGTIARSYCTGLVKGVTTQGAFAGSLVKAPTDCAYFEIINESKDDSTGSFTYMNAVGKPASGIAITPFDATAQSYNLFVGAPSDWEKSSPYNKKLIDYYHDEDKIARFTLHTVRKLGATVQTEPQVTGGITTPADFVAVHYGDWPVPEIFVLN